jgi:hypothetical protein
MFRRTRLASPVASWSRRCVLAEAVLVSLALPLPSSAQQLPMLPFGG